MRIVSKIFSIFILSTLINLSLNSQNETKKWYFTSLAGLDFTTTPPTILTNGSLNTGEGCASVSDSNGNILFYTNGMTIWDKTHNVMANGSGLYGGGGSTSQAAIIVKQLGSPSLYYTFTNEAQNGFNYGLHYSIVDMSLASGNGSVTLKNVPLFAGTTEKLCATKHKNGTDVWVLTHEFNSVNFRAYLITAAGVNTTAVTTAIGTSHDNYGAIGYMKVSPDGKKIGLAIYSTTNTGSFELYDFDNSTGAVSNPVILGNNYSEPYGCEFSPDGKKFYGGGWTNGTVFQWNLCAGSNTSIIASQFIISTTTLSIIGGMQLALNGKIYVSRIGEQTIGVINNPNAAGTSCNYVELGQSIAPNGCGYGLPNFMSSYFWPGATLSVTTSGSFSMCAGETKTLSVSGASTFTWNSTTVSSTLAVSPTITSSYSVVGTTSVGCVFDAAITVSVNACTGVGEVNNFDFVKIYPNPVRNILNLELENETSNCKILLFNTLNVLLFSKDITTATEQINIDFLPSGLYYLRVEREKTTFIYKIVKE